MRLLTTAERLLARRFAAILEAHGRTPDDWRVICLLADGAGHPMTELARGAFLPPASLTRLVDHLVDDNLLYRRVDDLDRRVVRAYLTPRGRRLHERVDEQLRTDLAGLCVASGDCDELARLLATLVEALAPAPARVA